MMPRYAITEKAGRFVAAYRNTGVGMVLELTEKQAEHELRLGSVVALDTAPASAPPTPALPAETAMHEESSPPIGPEPESPRKVRRSKQ
jgi:hypothetical protein